jgi:putative ABC transport system ATP-binding protein
VGLGQRLDHRPHQLSGGQQQRVAVARALVNTPDVVLADEPTGNLDSKTSDEIMMLMQNLNEERGVTIIVITHEPDIAEFAQRIIAFKDGLVVEDRVNPPEKRRGRILREA